MNREHEDPPNQSIPANDLAKPVPQEAARAVPGLKSSATPTLALSIPAEIGRYRVEGLLGMGGFGAVYLAVDSTLGRKVINGQIQLELIIRPVM